MNRAMVKDRFSKADQKDLTDTIEKWRSEKPDEKFFFRDYGEDKLANVFNKDGNLFETAKRQEKHLLCCHSNKDKRRLSGG